MMLRGRRDGGEGGKHKKIDYDDRIHGEAR